MCARLWAFRIFNLCHTLSQSTAQKMMLGYCLIIVPTGIVSAELAHVGRKGITTQVCLVCMAEGHDPDAVHCKYCGARL